MAASPENEAPSRPELLELVAAQELRIRRVESERDRAHREGFREGRDEWAAETRRWRTAYEAIQQLLAESLTVAAEEQVEKLDEAVRGWVGKA